MILSSVTNNIYGSYGAGPVATKVAKSKPEPKHKKYLRREPKITFEQEKSKAIVEEASAEITVEEKIEESIDDEIETVDFAEEKDENTEVVREEEKVEE